MNIIVSGYVAAYPIAGFFWHYVSYLLGFRELGHDVWFLEDSGDEPWGWDVAANRPDPSLRAGTTFLSREMGALGLGDRWMVRVAPTGTWRGQTSSDVSEVVASADVLVDVSC